MKGRARLNQGRDVELGTVRDKLRDSGAKQDGSLSRRWRRPNVDFGNLPGISRGIRCRKLSHGVQNWLIKAPKLKPECGAFEGWDSRDHSTAWVLVLR